MRESMRSPCEESPKNEHPEGHAAATGHQAEGLEVEDFCTTDSHSALETEGAHGLGGPVAASLYLESCHAHGVVPASCLLRQGNASELNLRHRGLGPQGAQALASMLASNVYIKHLDLRDNGLRRAGAEALADVLCKNRVISDVDLSENQIGAAGLQAICAALALNPTVQKIQLEGNRLEEQAAQHLAALLLLHTGLKSLDLSYNQLSDLAGETLGPALAENTGLTELNLSWNHLRGPGAIAFARGLEANIFLKVLDISHNGFGDAGASAIGEALKANNVLEELNMRNNRISAAGALKLGLGLQVNQTLRILTISKNPIRNEGCVGLLKSVGSNRSSALELLDLSVCLCTMCMLGVLGVQKRSEERVDSPGTGVGCEVPPCGRLCLPSAGIEVVGINTSPLWFLGEDLATVQHAMHMLNNIIATKESRAHSYHKFNLIYAREAFMHWNARKAMGVL